MCHDIVSCDCYVHLGMFMLHDWQARKADTDSSCDRIILDAMDMSLSDRRYLFRHRYDSQLGRSAKAIDGRMLHQIRRIGTDFVMHGGHAAIGTWDETCSVE